MTLMIDAGAAVLLSRLRRAGYQAYVVGGCVRDLLYGRAPKDWDICTDALPAEICTVFCDLNIIPTGLQHGTVTVLYADKPYEITTFRIDGVYTDHRRPEQVSFSADLSGDLSRRDFTMNAMAYAPFTGLADPYHGQSCLQERVIRCVGDPEARFQEDALRILRALRFAAVFGLTIDPDTEAALLHNAYLLRVISKERIREELCKLLLGKYSLDVLLRYQSVFAVCIPEFYLCINFRQNNPYHIYNVYDHIAHATANYTGNDLIVKLTLLLHDIGKPFCYSEDERGGHFHGHGVVSRNLAAQVLRRLRFDNLTIACVLPLVLYHDATIEPTPKVVRRWLARLGEKQYFRLMEVRLADIRAHSPNNRMSRIKRCLALRRIAREVLQEQPCLTLKDLAIDGYEVMKEAIPEGKLVGLCLNHALEQVINGTVPNEKHALLQTVRDFAMEYCAQHRGEI